jgi:hypothetical protein
MAIAKIYPLDAVYDTLEDVPQEVMLMIYDILICLSVFLLSLWFFFCCRLKQTKDMLVPPIGLLRLAILSFPQ